MVRSFESVDEKLIFAYASEILHLSKKDIISNSTRERNKENNTEVIIMKAESKTETIVVDFIEHLLNIMGIEYNSINTQKGSDKTWVKIDVDNPARLIGRKGQALNALQLLVNTFVQRQTENVTHIVVDITDYRERRIETIEAIVDRAIEQVRKTRKSKLLYPMNAFERRIVHGIINKTVGVDSVSEGEDDSRAVRIIVDGNR